MRRLVSNDALAEDGNNTSTFLIKDIILTSSTIELMNLTSKNTEPRPTKKCSRYLIHFMECGEIYIHNNPPDISITGREGTVRAFTLTLFIYLTVIRTKRLVSLPIKYLLYLLNKWNYWFVTYKNVTHLINALNMDWRLFGQFVLSEISC